MGGVFLFPNVQVLSQYLPGNFLSPGNDIGTTVEHYLLQHHNLAVVLGSVYGQVGSAYIRLTSGGGTDIFNRALERLTQAGRFK
jgi:aspartate/methionine/tyrosine aminotransferase